MTPFGLHASADPGISAVEIQEFKLARPDLIKVQSFNAPARIKELSQAFPNAQWIVRAFLDFGGRAITADQFFTDTISDVRRTLDAIGPKLKTEVAVELHNEPNLVAEGWGKSWQTGRNFSNWFIELVGRYWDVLPNVRYMFPGLSVGDDVPGVRLNDLKFFQDSLPALWHSNGYGVHAYWQAGGLENGLGAVDRYKSMVPGLRYWVTEAGNLDPAISAPVKGYEYIQFVERLKSRPYCQGATFFVASATNPAFAPLAWLSYYPKTNTYETRGIGKVVGTR